MANIQYITFKRNSFYDFKKNNYLKNIISNSNFLDYSIIHSDYEVIEISTFDNLKENSLLFLDFSIINQDLIKKINNFKNIHVFTNAKKNNLLLKLNSYSLCDNLKKIYSEIINLLLIDPDNIKFIDKFIKKNNSFISKHSFIDKSVKIGNNCIIGRGVIIKKNCIIKDNVIIKNSILEENCIIHENAVIGSTGFGFDALNSGVNILEPQIGIVFLSKNCSIGASTTIDRAKINITFLGPNCMLDNLVHIAHNVILGSNVIIAAQSGIAGSTILGNNIKIGGHVGISGHLKIGNNIMIAGKSAVTKGIRDNTIVAGYPAIEIKKWRKMIVKQRSNK